MLTSITIIMPFRSFFSIKNLYQFVSLLSLVMVTMTTRVVLRYMQTISRDQEFVTLTQNKKKIQTIFVVTHGLYLYILVETGVQNTNKGF